MKIEEQFEKEFGFRFNIGVVPDDITKKNIKAFYRQKLKELAERLVKEIKEKEFKLGEREWCKECANRITKQMKKILKDEGIIN